MAHLVAKATALSKKLVAQARPHLDEFMRYAKVELSPPLPADFGNIRNLVEKTKNDANIKKGIGQITVRDVWLNTLVTIEVITWFFMGEVIGKRHLVGYKV